MAQVVVTMQSDVAKLIRDQERVIKKQEELIAKFRDTGNAAKGAGDAAGKGGKQAQDAWGPKLSGMVTSAISQFATVTAAINLVTDALRFMQEETDKAKASFERLADSRRRLTQVALDSRDLQALEDRADQLAAEFGVDRDIVRQVIFSARSEGFEDVVEDIIASARSVKPEAAASVAGQLPGLFEQSGISPITPLEAINAVLKASRESRLDFEQIASAIPRAAEGAGRAGASPAETMALASVLATSFATGETTADRIKALGSFIANTPEFAGRGIADVVEEISAMPDEARRELLGSSQEVNAAFVTVSERLDKIRERQAVIEEAIAQTGTAASELATRNAAAFDVSTPGGRLNRAQQQAESSRIEREIAAERAMAEGGFQREAAINRVVAELQSEGDNLGAFGAQRAGEAADLLGVGEDGAEVASRMGAAGVEAVIPMLSLFRNTRRTFFPQSQSEASAEIPAIPGSVGGPRNPGLAPPAAVNASGPQTPSSAAGADQDAPMSRSARDLSQAAKQLEQAASRLGQTATTRPAFAPRQRASAATNPE